MKTYFTFAFGIMLLLSGCQDKPSANGISVGAESVSTAAQAVPKTSLVRSLGQDELPSESGVGIVTNGEISSTGKEGYLIFGPYAALDAGTYQVTVSGAVDSLSEGSHVTVDVVSNQGANTLGSVEISADSATGMPLAEFTATLPSDVSDMEVRVFVPANSRVSVSGYRVEPKE